MVRVCRTRMASQFLRVLGIATCFVSVGVSTPACSSAVDEPPAGQESSPQWQGAAAGFLGGLIIEYLPPQIAKALFMDALVVAGVSFFHVAGLTQQPPDLACARYGNKQVCRANEDILVEALRGELNNKQELEKASAEAVRLNSIGTVREKKLNCGDYMRMNTAPIHNNYCRFPKITGRPSALEQLIQQFKCWGVDPRRQVKMCTCEYIVPFDIIDDRAYRNGVALKANDLEASRAKWNCLKP